MYRLMLSLFMGGLAWQSAPAAVTGSKQAVPFYPLVYEGYARLRRGLAKFRGNLSLAESGAIGKAYKAPRASSK